jgi:hypothetical protein
LDNFFQFCPICTACDTAKSFSETIILASTNPQYDKRLFMVIHEQSVVILWVNWCKNKSFWQRFTCNERFFSHVFFLFRRTFESKVFCSSPLKNILIYELELALCLTGWFSTITANPRCLFWQKIHSWHFTALISQFNSTLISYLPRWICPKSGLDISPWKIKEIQLSVMMATVVPPLYRIVTKSWLSGQSISSVSSSSNNPLDIRL